MPRVFREVFVILYVLDPIYSPMNKTVKIIIAIFVWLCAWMLSDITLGTTVIERLLPHFDQYSANVRFGIYSFWLLIICAIISITWFKKIKEASFLKIKNKAWLLLYIIPITFIVIIAIHGNQQSGNVNQWNWTISIILSTFFAQDLVTFGFLQTYLEKQLKPFHAALLTAAVFFVGHLIGQFQFDVLTLIYFLGFILFAIIRYKTKNIYIVNVLHLSFLLLPF